MKNHPGDAAAAALSFGWLKPLAARLAAVRAPRRLRLVESLPLGEKRCLALVEVGGRQLLIGATATSISLLDRLPGSGEEHRADGLSEC